MFPESWCASSVTHVGLLTVTGDRARIEQVAADFRMMNPGETVTRIEMRIGQVIFRPPYW